MRSIFIIVCILFASFELQAYEVKDIVSARIETCRGCSLNRLPEVKRFVMNDAPNYDRVEVKFITGAPPELVLLGENDHELDRLALSELQQQECNELIQKYGFFKKIKSEF